MKWYHPADFLKNFSGPISCINSSVSCLAVYLGQHVNDDIAEGVMSEFFHNMSHQVLDGQNTTILSQFSELMNLMDELRALFVEGAETAVKQSKEMLEKANKIMNDYKFA